MFVHTQGPKLRTRGEEGPATLNPPNSEVGVSLPLAPKWRQEDEDANN